MNLLHYGGQKACSESVSNPNGLEATAYTWNETYPSFLRGFKTVSILPQGSLGIAEHCSGVMVALWANWNISIPPRNQTQFASAMPSSDRPRSAMSIFGGGSSSSHPSSSSASNHHHHANSHHHHHHHNFHHQSSAGNLKSFCSGATGGCKRQHDHNPPKQPEVVGGATAAAVTPPTGLGDRGGVGQPLSKEERGEAAGDKDLQQQQQQQQQHGWFKKNLIGRTPSLPSSLGKKKQSFLKVRASLMGLPKYALLSWSIIHYICRSILPIWSSTVDHFVT